MEGGVIPLTTLDDFSAVLAPDAKQLATLTEPREFNLMMKTYLGCRCPAKKAPLFCVRRRLRVSFVNFKNVRGQCKLAFPSVSAQIGKSFRNEITPRNFTFRSREFEQMEIEFFCHPDRRPTGTSIGVTAGSTGTRI